MLAAFFNHLCFTYVINEAHLCVSRRTTQKFLTRFLLVSLENEKNLTPTAIITAALLPARHQKCILNKEYTNIQAELILPVADAETVCMQSPTENQTEVEEV